jgi:hypothetical protein
MEFMADPHFINLPDMLASDLAEEPGQNKGSNLGRGMN